MALVIEDGTGIAGANSFVDVPTFRAYAAARGIALPVADADVEILLVKAMDYLSLYESRLVGVQLDPAQSLIWPRVAYPAATTAPWWESAVPGALPRAQMALAVHAIAGPLLQAERPTTDRGPIKSVTVGPITTEYAGAKTASPDGQPRFPDVDMILRSFLRGSVTSIIARRG